jgi:hypothetical protein
MKEGYVVMHCKDKNTSCKGKNMDKYKTSLILDCNFIFSRGYKGQIYKMTINLCSL